jgi:hypothetical protein
MVVLLLALLLTQATSGLFTYDQVFTRGPLARWVSEEWVDFASTLHVKNFYWLLAAIVAHVVAVGVYFVAKSHDLLGPMIHGEKKLPADIPPPRMASPAFGLALLPFVIPAPTLAYPLLTLAGTAWLMLVVKLDQILKIRFCNPQ